MYFKNFCTKIVHLFFKIHFLITILFSFNNLSYDKNYAKINLGEIMRIKIFEEDIFMPEPVGKQPKYWFKSYNERFLFKLATLKQDGTPIYNDVSECMAADVAKYLDIPSAEYYLCEKNGELGVITKDFLNNGFEGPKKEEFFDGVYLIHQIDPGFKNKSLINPKTHQYYTVDLILRSVEKYGFRKEVLNMLIFDALIGNRDRNPSNYGIIINHENNSVRFAPLYDSCASLGISMVQHRLDKCFNTKGIVINAKHLDTVVHHHIIGKVTLDRFLLYKDKREWDKEEGKRILSLIEQKRRELVPLLESDQITKDYYHKELIKIGDQYRKFDITTLQYQSLISYLTLNYPFDIEEIMDKISNIDESVVNQLFDYYKDELPIERLNMAKQIVLKRAKWMSSYYYNNKDESRGKVL